jgi:3-(3-hydroxy-phenyl)propionate hydroxylase
MNAGLRDAHNVAWKIAAVLKGGADDGILDTYETERRKPAWDMIQLAVTMGNVVMPAGEEQIAFRDMLLKALQPYPDVRDYLIQMRFKPKPRCHAGLFLDLEQPVLEASLVGEMIPQPDVLDNGSKTLLDEKLGSGFALISQDDRGEKALSGLHRTEFLGLPLATLHLAAADAAEVASSRCADGAIARPLRTHRDQILLVRPDRYCAAAILPDRLDDEVARYESLFSADNRSSSPEISPAVATSTSR